MQEIELKLELDGAQETRLRRSARLRALSEGPAKTQSLWSIYYDTPEQDLRALGIALRLRRAGGEWVQTLKRATSAMQSGLSTPLEIEYPVSGQWLDLTRIPDHDLREQMIGIARTGLQPVAETRFRRTSYMLALPDGSARTELALDKGEVGFGEKMHPFIEAEFELREGSAAALYEMAQQVMPCGPIRFATASKSERARAVAEGATVAQLRKAKPVDLADARNVEEAAILILGEGSAHAAPNIALVLDSDDINGPHQMRVGLRRLRSALTAFRGPLGSTLTGFGERARLMAAEAGKMRDLDVLSEEIIQKAQRDDPVEQGYQVLLNATETQRLQAREAAKKTLMRPEYAMFALDFAAFLACRGWIDGSDHVQTARLAQPIDRFAQRVLNKRWKAVRRWGDRIDELSIDERHEMRKEVKKLRYLVDAFQSLFDPEDVAAFTRQVKRLQKAFGALNDFTMAEVMLTAPEAPGHDDPVAQRAVGKIIGRLQVRSEALWPSAVSDWADLAASKPFWRKNRK